MNKLIQEIRKCTICEEFLPAGCRPVLSGTPTSKLVIIGQAPGRVVHASGVPWDDKSGENLRSWLSMDKELFYDETKVAIIPMGFCYPGTGKSGDLPPRKECAPQWHQQLWDAMNEVTCTLLIGQYAQVQYLGRRRKRNLTETVKCFEEYLPQFFPLPHPSPRNNIWQAKNPWFKEEVLPVLKMKMGELL